MMDKYDSVSIFTYAEKQVDYNLFESLWIPCSAKFVTLGATSTSAGIIQVYELSDGKIKLLKEVSNKFAYCTYIIYFANYVDVLQKKHDKSIKCGTFGASSIVNRHLATGDFCGNLDIW